MPEGQRRLSAIMFTDMVGYTALTQTNESLALEVLARHHRLLRPIFPRFGGIEVRTMGDSFLVEFDSALNAANCAVEIQQYLHQYNLSSNDEWKIRLRIGVHLGDVVHASGDVLGDAVNLASRIEPLAEVGGVCVSEQVFDQVRNKISCPLVRLEPKELKNVRFKIDVYKIVMPWETAHIIAEGPLDPSRIAVLPFANMSQDPNDSYFADGITEEIISTLANVSGLSVISRTSIMSYKGTTKKLKEIGYELEAGSVLEGSFRKAGSKIRVTTQLIAVENDRHVWAQSYDRSLEDVFAVQTDIAKQVADSLSVRILAREVDRIERKPTESAEAYTLYLRGRFHWNKRGVQDIKKAAEYFDEAVREDPKFALGYVGLADCHQLLSINWGIDRVSNMKKARAELVKALELDVDLAEAHTSRALILFHDYKLREAEQEFKNAINLKPSYASAHQWYSHLLLSHVRWEEAFNQIEKAVELDPLSLIINFNRCAFYYSRRDYRKALELAKKTAELDPNFAGIHLHLIDIYGKMKMMDEAKHEAKIVAGLAQETYPLMVKMAEARIAYNEDDKEEVRKLVFELEAGVGEPAGPDAMEVAEFYFFLGEIDKGFEWMEKSYLRREYWLLYIKSDQFLDGVREDPRYNDLLNRLGLE